MTEPADDSAIVGIRRPPMTRNAYVGLVLMAVVIVGVLVWDFVRDRWSTVIFLPILAVNAVYPLRPPTVIDAEGIRRPWRRPRTIGWPEVASVVAPQPGLDWTRVRLTNGKTIDLSDIPAERSAAVAALGGRAVVTDEPVRRPPPRVATRTDREIEDDVQRRAQALTAERQEMEVKSRRIRPVG